MSAVAPCRAGSHLDYFILKTPSLAAARALHMSNVALAEPKPENFNPKLATATLKKHACVLSLRRKDIMACRVSFAGHYIPVVPFPKGIMALVDLALDPTPYNDGTLDYFSFFVRRETFDELADGLGGNRIDNLAIKAGVATDDRVVGNLGSCLRLAIECPELVNALFVDRLVTALHAHFAKQYGGMCIPRTGGGGLTTRQLQIACDTVDAHLDGQISLALIGSACGLSARHFSRAFTYSTGVPPHRWLMRRRIERAKDLMRNTTASLAEIALACGFSDQSHLSDAFSKCVGMPPGRWRHAKQD